MSPEIRVASDMTSPISTGMPSAVAWQQSGEVGHRARRGTHRHAPLGHGIRRPVDDRTGIELVCRRQSCGSHLLVGQADHATREAPVDFGSVLDR